MTARATRDVPAHLSVCAYAVTLCVVVTAIRYQPVQVVTGPAAPKAIDTQRHEELVRSQAKLQREIEGASDLVRELGYRLEPGGPTQTQGHG